MRCQFQLLCLFAVRAWWPLEAGFHPLTLAVLIDQQSTLISARAVIIVLTARAPTFEIRS